MAYPLTLTVRRVENTLALLDELVDVASDFEGYLVDAWSPSLADPDPVEPRDLASLLDEPAKLRRPRTGHTPATRLTWHCTVRNTAGLPLDDAAWRWLARAIVTNAGFTAAEGRPGCRWIAVLTQHDRLDLVATVIREDGRWANQHGSSWAAASACNRLAYALAHRAAASTSDRQPDQTARSAEPTPGSTPSRDCCPPPTSACLALELDALLASLNRNNNTRDLLSYLFGPGAAGRHADPRLVAGDAHGARLDLLAASPYGVPYLAQALDAPMHRAGVRAPDKPVWVCRVRSSPQFPDLSDQQWADVARRVVSVTGVAPEGDPDACRWIAVRNQPGVVVIVANRVREDGRLHNGYRDAAHIQGECDRIAAELGHLPTDSTPAVPQQRGAGVPIIITAEPSGSVTVRGGVDELAAAMLRRAGFEQLQDWHGMRHRLPSTCPPDRRTAVASFAATMLHAARYDVTLDRALDTEPPAPPAVSLGRYAAGADLLQVTDRIKAATTGAELAAAVDPLLHPEHGAAEHLREALEAVEEQIRDLDEESFQLSDRFGFAAEFVCAAQSELVDHTVEMLSTSDGTHTPGVAAVRSAARTGAAAATSPAATRTHLPLPQARPPTPGQQRARPRPLDGRPADDDELLLHHPSST